MAWPLAHQSRSWFCYEGATVTACGLLTTSPTAKPTPTSDSGACATTTNSALTTDASLALCLNLDISMVARDGLVDADAHGAIDDVVPLHPLPPLLHTMGTHNHPDGPMLGFVIPEHDGVDCGPRPRMDVCHALKSPSQGLSFDLASLNCSGEGSIEWRTGNILGGAGVSTDTGVGKYAGDGTISLSVLGRSGNLNPGKLGDDPSSPVHGFGGM
ncbi:hypothetical protein EDB85DRAFT_1890617 [Lactarius pseudohatsudake]|nr:hypothetical protein EDB85DRAFT_1890617 [Lactarius pseudohatsudake]